MPVLGPLDPLELARSAAGAVAAASRRVRPDHLPIRQRAVQWHVGGSMTHFFLYAVIAPSRSAPRRFDDGQVRRAQAFVAAAFPDVFQQTPVWADDRFTLFAVEDSDGGRLHQLYVHRSGLIELLWPLTPTQSEQDDAALMLDAGEIVCVVDQLAGAVAGDTYREISRAGRGRRRFARVDWWFQLAGSVSGETGQRPWTGLRFAAEAPPRAANHWPAAPTYGYGGEQLGSVRRRTPGRVIARNLLSEIVKANGYYDFAACVEHTVTGALSEGRPTTGGRPAESASIEESLGP
jgi:hypothetical protein